MVFKIYFLQEVFLDHPMSPASLESPVPPRTAWLSGGTLDLVPGASPFSLSLGFAIPAQGAQTLGCLFTAVPEPDP